MRTFVIKTIFLLSFAQTIFGQKTMILGKVDCFDKKSDCCLYCPQIVSIDDSVTVTPDHNGNFKLILDKKTGTFNLGFYTIGVLTLWITDIPYQDTISFETIYLINAKIISLRQYRHIERKLMRDIKGNVERHQFIEKNYTLISPIGRKSFYFDISHLPLEKIENPVDNDKLVEIIKNDDKIIKLKYTDLIKTE